jgi:hypothetical protein
MLKLLLWLSGKFGVDRRKKIGPHFSEYITSEHEETTGKYFVFSWSF